jgi:hypothetical protein
MIGMPMGQEYVGDTQLMSVKKLSQCGEPNWNALRYNISFSLLLELVVDITDLPHVYQNSCFAASNKICVGSLHLHVTWVSTHYPHNFFA